jgi:iron(III) transport system substrate-binding protein
VDEIMSTMQSFLLPSFLLVILLVGCAKTQEPEVVIYVAVDRKDSEPILADFQQRTGIRVRAVYDAEATKTTGLVSRLVAEANRPRCDLFWNNEFMQTIQLAERGLLEPYQSDQTAAISERYRDEAGRWYAQAARARVLVYNTRLVLPDELPRGLRELAGLRLPSNYCKPCSTIRFVS